MFERRIEEMRTSGNGGEIGTQDLRQGLERIQSQLGSDKGMGV